MATVRETGKFQYDYPIVATDGWFGHEEWAAHATVLKRLTCPLIVTMIPFCSSIQIEVFDGMSASARNLPLLECLQFMSGSLTELLKRIDCRDPYFIQRHVRR